MRKLLYISFVYLLVTIVMSCGRSVDKRLVLADTLMWTNPDSSLVILESINRDSLQGEENLAYHALLLTQARFRVDYYDYPSDSLINTALDYFSDNHNREHYTRSLLYKGAYYEVHDNPVEAIKWYKRAEDNADTTDYRNLAQINMRMGMIYHNSYISTGEDVLKFKKSLNYYRRLDGKKNEMLCLLYIGEKLRVSNDPKAVDYIQQAMRIAIELKDTFSIVNAMECMARNYIYSHNYDKAHIIAQSCINSYPLYLNEDIILDEARACAFLGKIDSAQVYIKLIKIDEKNDESKVHKLYTLADVALAKGDKSTYVKNKRTADSICEAIQIKRDSLSLLQTESEFNEHKIEQTTSKNALFKLVVWGLLAFFVIVAVSFVSYYFIKKRDWKNLLEEHKNANNELIKKNIEVSNVNEECKNAIFELLKRIDEWVILKQSLPKDVFANKFEESFALSKRKKKNKKELEAERKNKDNNEKIIEKYIITETGDFWLNVKSLADATFGKDLKTLKEEFPKLSKDDLYIIALKYLGFSYITIAVCMGYKDKSYVNKKKNRIPQKLGLDITFEEFLNSLKNKG